MDEPLRSTLAAAFPDRTPTDAASGGPSWNRTNETYRVTFAEHPPVYLKHGTEPDGTRTARECGALAYAGHAAPVRVSEIAAADPDERPPYLATRALDGEPFDELWYDGDRDPALARRLGATVAALHEIRLDRHGWFGLADRSPGADTTQASGDPDHSDEIDATAAASEPIPLCETDSDGVESLPRLPAGRPAIHPVPFPDLLIATIREHQRIAPTDRFAESYDRLVAAIETNRSTLADAPAVYCHADPAGPNFQVPATDDESDHADDDTPALLAALDLEMAHAGDPARDLYRAQDQTMATPPNDAPERLVDALHEGYRARAGRLPPGYEERKPIYAAERVVGDAGFADRLAEWTDRSVADLDAWFREEIDRRLSAIE